MQHLVAQYPAVPAWRSALAVIYCDLGQHDLARATQAQAEIEWLSHELAAARGLGGRDRQVGSDAERARSTLTKAIKTAIHKIAQHHPALGHHLATHLKTGLFCQYRPAPGQATLWTL
ncbi:MAG: hypothetical protein FJZ47_22275 [Candidatus Tectomicrobia bacterium]|uniref:Uncharacterized protein n=1 Tax=Tectimicrobiota bacterium TaxID=2528274 RepID=A0A938B4I5_UNCTE|nr:hypothetical protein [Candidatus Tectomicrobia bacterium]